jgi:hypothetical protein
MRPDDRDRILHMIEAEEAAQGFIAPIFQVMISVRRRIG